MRIGIIGNGVVGGATAEAFKEHEIRIFDKVGSRSTHTLFEVLASDISFVCLPTPQKKDSMECNTSAIDDFFYTISFDGDFVKTNLVLRSTVPVGYTKRAREILGLENLVHSPEFLTARTAKKDACNPTRMVIGDSRRIGIPRRLTQLYQDRWPDVPVFHMTSDESEFVKLLQNSFSAVKIAFFNEVWSFAQKKGLDWQRCLEALLAGGWVNPMHTQVPGPDGKFGFGGACLSKDVASLGFQLLQEGLRADMMFSAHSRNLTDRERES